MLETYLGHHHRRISLSARAVQQRLYMAKDEDIIHEHARRSGFPATKITEIRKIIDPTTEHE